MQHTLKVLAASLVIAVQAYAQTPDVPAPVKAPEGHKAAMTWTGTGELTYECRAKVDNGAMFEWAFVGPDAKLTDTKSRAPMGRYYAGPTWEAADGGKVTGKQVAVAPSSPGNIPLQLVKADVGSGTLEGVTYIQRVNTKGGVAPSDRCDAAASGAKKTVSYSADYVFYRAN